ncbi:E3 ubiquitin-protein ligase TRIM71-like [Saccostrea cucullata]|uniref:E3 ubiquitin-protein ligase TRIM71-like n=1 Tax=Saccostrea cuccullata TaxID=36930 RepID=UPI002ED27C39
MATAQGQDIICCKFCPNPVEHHCNLCHMDLCPSCIPKHMDDNSREHEVVGYTSRKKDTIVLPKCNAHEKKQCEMYCKDCKTPMCVQCLMDSHKKHEFTDIKIILQDHKQKLLSDTEELENTIVPKYRNISLGTTAEFDKVLSTIKEQEDKICKAVHEKSIQLTEEVSSRKKKAIRKNKESQSLAEKAEKEVNQIVTKNKDILNDNDATAILKYQSRNGDFRKGPHLQSFSCPMLLPGIIKENHITEMFGFLQTRDELQEKPRMLKMIDVPLVLGTIQSPYGNHEEFGIEHQLRNVQCVGRDKILTSGGDKTIKEIDRTGSILRTIHTNAIVWALTINSQMEPVHSISYAHKQNADIYVYNKKAVNVLFSILNWFPVGLCYTDNGDLLVSMRSMDKTQSKVVRYSGTTEIRKIQYDSQGQPLFSTGDTNVLLLTENGNGDICVSDNKGKAVVVMNSSGGLRFKYKGNLFNQSKYREFEPCNISTDVNTQILISDLSNNVVHIIDCNGNFVRYIENLCNGRLSISIDEDHNLLIGESKSGKIQIIKYLE